MTKILIVHSVLVQDGATRLAIGDALLLRGQGYEVEFASGPGPLESELKDQSIPVHRLYFVAPLRYSKVVRYCLGVPVNVALLLWLVVRHRYRCLYMNHRQSVIPGMLISGLTGVPYVFNAISEFGKLNRGPRFTPLGSHVIAVSEQVKRNVTAHFHVSPDKVTAIPPAIKTDVARVGQDVLNLFNQTWSIPSRAKVVACVAMLVEIKGHDVLLTAWKRVLDDSPHAVLVLTGTGPLRERLTSQCVELGITSNVRFTGLVDDVSVVYSRANVVVLASRSEGLSLSILEAFSYGVPVVCTAVSGMPEIVLPEKTGLLVEPDNPGQLSDAMIRLLSEPELGVRLGRAGRQLVEEEYSIKVRAAALAEYFKKL